jgi:hypothetical protein
MVRLGLGPPLLALMAATQAVRVTGPATVALAHPPPPWQLAIADVLAVSALGALAFWVAAALAGKRGQLSHYVIPVAGAQLPLAGVALLVGRQVLATAVAGAAAGTDGEEFLKHPLAMLSPLVPTAVAVLLLTVLVLGALFVGYRRVSQLEGWRLPVSFAGGLLGAEVVCRLWSWWSG